MFFAPAFGQFKHSTLAAGQYLILDVALLQPGWLVVLFLVHLSIKPYWILLGKLFYFRISQLRLLFRVGIVSVLGSSIALAKFKVLDFVT